MINPPQVLWNRRLIFVHQKTMYLVKCVRDLQEGLQNPVWTAMHLTVVNVSACLILQKRLLQNTILWIPEDIQSQEKRDVINMTWR